jgi:DNA-binding transcriptional MerR regulator
MNCYRTKDIARFSKCSVQKVRNWEALGFLPPVERNAKGYRCYTDRHIEAFQVSQTLGFSWVVTLDIMKAVHRSDLAAALTIIDTQQVALYRQREQTKTTLEALCEASKTIQTHDIRIYEEPVTIGAAAEQVGVRVSAVRFWEQQGLLEPIREKYNRYRRYDADQMKRLRIITLLRECNYSFSAIRIVLAEVTAGNVKQAVSAAEYRLSELTQISLKRLRGLAQFWGYIEKYYSDQLASLM